MKKIILSIILVALIINVFVIVDVCNTTNRLEAKYNAELEEMKTTYEDDKEDFKLKVRNYVLGDGWDLLFDKVGDLDDAFQIRINKTLFEEEFRHIINNY